ncbi:MAG TPA: histone deacetylase family protein [Thiolinea sp.]|nr:histone deacetylase family protein [Thiolinea sp.]
MTTALISHSDCIFHDNGDPYHPESPKRIGAITDRLISSGVDWIIRHYDAEPASREQLERAHTPAYIQRVFDSAPQGQELILLDGDTGMNRYSLSAALHAAGAVVMGVDLVLKQQHRNVFCAIRPPGHHAGRAVSAGFCIFNNVAIGCLHALEHYGLKRVAIIDFDVHHGDGTEEIVRDDPRVLFCSSFQHPYYPYCGADSNYPNVVNLPMRAGTRGPEWRTQVEQHWLPRLHDFKPELIMVSAGFDSHLEDEMGGFGLVEADYTWITRKLCEIAAQYGQGQLVSCLEGGYDLSSLARSVTVHVKEMAEY